jgi:hypothetical protein
MKICKLKENQANYYVVLEELDAEIKITQLFLAGYVSEDSFLVKPEDVSMVPDPPPQWKAAFLVWKNTEIFHNIKLEEIAQNDKYRKKTIELLAEKYKIDKESLFKLLSELEDS